jgi:hypothetical protein
MPPPKPSRHLIMSRIEPETCSRLDRGGETASKEGEMPHDHRGGRVKQTIAGVAEQREWLPLLVWAHTLVLCTVTCLERDIAAAMIHGWPRRAAE